MLANAQRVYCLREYTVAKRRRGWYFSRASSFGQRSKMKGPYRSMSSLTLMIARELKREIIRRDAPYRLEGER